MATEKTVNYTTEQTANMIELYTATPTRETVEAIATNLGKSARSIIAKLSREKVYIAKVYKTKTGESVTKKVSLIDKLTELVDLTEPEATSFEHVNKTALVKLLAALS